MNKPREEKMTEYMGDVNPFSTLADELFENYLASCLADAEIKARKEYSNWKLAKLKEQI